MTPTAVLLAAGRGERLGGDRPKALVEVAGRTLLEHALAGLQEAGVADVVVVHPPGAGEVFAPLAPSARLVAGGATRTASVRAGLGIVAAGVTVVAVHDAARAFTPASVIRRAVEAVRGDVVAAAPARPVTDTLKRVAGSEVVDTVAREQLVAVQTPQVFRREVLELALGRGEEASDDLALVERLLAAGGASGRVVTVEGSTRGLKITWPDDVLVARALSAARP